MSPRNQEKSRPRSKSKGRPTCFYYRKPRHFQKNCRHCWKDKGGVDGVEAEIISDRKDTSRIAASEEELLFISEQNEVNFVGEESIMWVVNSGVSFHLVRK